MIESEAMSFLRANSSAVFGLLGALGGSALTFIFEWVGLKRQYDLRIWDKLLERRILAHERVIAIAQDLRTVIALGGVDGDGETSRTPQVLSTKQEFESWLLKFHAANTNSTWFTIEVRREMNFAQDYLLTLHQHLKDAPLEAYRPFGELVRQDFLDLSGQLERKAFAFFEKDIRQLRLSSLYDWHKYPRPETARRFGETQFTRRWKEIEVLLKKGAR